MTVTKAIICCLFTSFAVHYGWRMRGTVIGGEKGAMVPGLFAGLSLALFAGGGIKEFFWIPAAAGLIGMTYGGIEPYGDSIALIEDPSYVGLNPKKGFAGLMLKGALWYSIAGGYIGMSMTSMSGRYTVKDIIIFILLVFALQFIGYRTLNWPYDKEKQIYPKIYLSFESRDEWGSNVGVLLAIIIMTALHKDILALAMTGCGFLFGAIGWFVAMKLYHYTEHPKKNGKYTFYGKLYKKGLLGGWGNMEYCLGSFGGLGIALGFVLSFSHVDKINETIASSGIFSPLQGYENVAIIIILVLFAALLIINILEYYWDEKNKEYSSFIMDCIERPFFNNLPFIFVLLCAVPSARLMTGFMAIYVLCIKNWFDRFRKPQPRTAFIIISGIFCLAVLIYDIICGGLSPLLIFISGGLPYIICEVVYNGTNKKTGGWKSVFTFQHSFGMILLTVQSILVAVLGTLIQYKL